MAVATPCQTPGAVFEIHIKPKKIEINIKLPKDIDFDLDMTQAETLEANLHNAIEIVLAQYFKKEDE